MKRATLCVIATIFLSWNVWSADINLGGVPTEIRPVIRAWGGDLDLGFKPVTLLPDRETIFWLGVGAAYEFRNYFHDPVTGDALASASYANAGFQQFDTYLQAGFSQGILAQPSTAGSGGVSWESHDLLQFFAYYLGGWSKVTASGSYLANSSAPDKDGYYRSSFLSGFRADAVTNRTQHGLFQGWYLEVSGETAPTLLQSVAVDFSRVNGNFRAYLPVFDLEPGKKENTLSLLFGVNVIADQLWGTQIPVLAQTSFGGLYPSRGVGGQIRGIESGRFDGKTKLMGNLELRLNLPGVYFDGTGPLIPGIVGFFDAGSWQDLPGQPSGYALTTGAGLYLNILNFGEVVVYGFYWLNGAAYDGSKFQWGPSLGMQF